MNRKPNRTLPLRLFALCLATLTLAPAQARAVQQVRPALVAPTIRVPASPALHTNPQVIAFENDLAAYRQTLAALQREGQQLEALRARLEARLQALSDSKELTMLQLQDLLSQRQQAVLTATELIKKMNDSAQSIIQNIK